MEITQQLAHSYCRNLQTIIRAHDKHDADCKLAAPIIIYLYNSNNSQTSQWNVVPVLSLGLPLSETLDRTKFN